MLSSTEDAQLLGISRQALDRQRKAGKALGVLQGSDWRYPAFQFTDGAVPPLIGSMLRLHKASSRWVILDVLLAEPTELRGRSLVEAAKEGDEVAVGRYFRQETTEAHL
jgi:hypothetical protein